MNLKSICFPHTCHVCLLSLITLPTGPGGNVPVQRNLPDNTELTLCNCGNGLGLLSLSHGVPFIPEKEEQLSQPREIASVECLGSRFKDNAPSL